MVSGYANTPGLLDRAQTAVARSTGALTSDYAANVLLAADVGMAEADGMPAYRLGWHWYLAIHADGRT